MISGQSWQDHSKDFLWFEWCHNIVRLYWPGRENRLENPTARKEAVVPLDSHKLLFFTWNCLHEAIEGSLTAEKDQEFTCSISSIYRFANLVRLKNVVEDILNHWKLCVRPSRKIRALWKLFTKKLFEHHPVFEAIVLLPRSMSIY